MKIIDVNKMIYNQIENNQYIDTFDLILKHELDVLGNNQTLRNYCIPERAKLLFVIKKKVQADSFNPKSKLQIIGLRPLLKGSFVG